MKKFRQFIKEALEAQAGENAGFREVHKFKHEGEEHHAVVNIAHNGDGNYKVVARIGKPGKVGFKNIKPSPILGGKIAAKVQGSVETFMKSHDWNSIALGGIDKRTKTKYQEYAKARVANDPSLEAIYGSVHNPIGGAVIIRKKTKIAEPKLSGIGSEPEYPKYDIKSRRGGSSSSGERSSSSNSNNRRPSSGVPDDNWVMKNKHSYSKKKAKDGDGGSIASSIAISASKAT